MLVLKSTAWTTLLPQSHDSEGFKNRESEDILLVEVSFLKISVNDPTLISLQHNTDNAEPIHTAGHQDECRRHLGWGHLEVGEGRPARWGDV